MESREDKAFNFPEYLQKKSTILDLLHHEVNSTISADKTLKRLEKTILTPEILRNLSFEQIMIFMDKLMRRQEKGKEFIIDFYRVTSKSQDIQNALKQCIMDKEVEGADAINPVESEKEFKQKLIGALDKVLELERREHEESIHRD